MTLHKTVICVSLCFFVLGCAARTHVRGGSVSVSDLPISTEAAIVDYTSPAEVMVQSAGIGTTTEDAILDARRCAVRFLIEGGSDPLLQLEDERSRFESVRIEFYSIPSVNQYISWESKGIKSRIKLEDGSLKLTKHFRVNKAKLRYELVRRRIIGDWDLITTFMVIPDVPKGENPLEAMNGNPTLKHIATVIESYLTSRGYDVLAPDRMDAINSLVEAQYAIKGIEEDRSYQIALVTGSDIYITYSLDMQTGQVGGSTVKKAIVGVRAYETTTAALLGAETGYSPERPAATQSVTEEACHAAIDNVLSRIDAKWRRDLSKGIPYKVVISIQGEFDSEEREDIAFAINRVMEKNCKAFRENIATDQTMDYLVRVDPQEINSSRKLYEALRRDFPTEFRSGRLRSINITRKLILLKVIGNND